MARWWEEYSCGCVSKKVSSKKDLLGYCPIHGNDRRALYKDFVPADETNIRLHRRAIAKGAQEELEEKE
jgi:hypothetical protein